MHLHVAIWDLAQKDGSTIAKVARTFMIERGVARAAVNAVESFVAAFLADIKQDRWSAKVQDCKSGMRQAGLNTFRFGKNPVTPADKKFKA
jgi:hypothetical protein